MSDSGNASSRRQNLIANARRWGWPLAIFNVIVRVAARSMGIHVYVVRVHPIPPEPSYPATNPDLVFRQIDTDELVAASTDPTLKMPTRFVEDAIARGDLAFGGFDGELLVSYIWRSAKSAPDTDGIWVRIRKPYNYAYKSFTRPEYRGQRISPVVHLFSDNEVGKLGFRYRVGFVAITNYASLNMGKHIGSKKIGHAGYLAWPGRLIRFRSRAVKNIGFDFFRPDKPA